MGVGLGLGGLILAWAVFLAAGEGVITIQERSERMQWQDK
jgi:hypothetical protein